MGKEPADDPTGRAKAIDSKASIYFDISRLLAPPQRVHRTTTTTGLLSAREEQLQEASRRKVYTFLEQRDSHLSASLK